MGTTAGRQRACQDFTPTEPAWRRRTGEAGLEEGAACPQARPGGTGQRALAPGVTRQASLLPLGRGIRVPAAGPWGPPAPLRWAAFYRDTVQGPRRPWSWGKPLGRSPGRLHAGLPRGQSRRRPAPQARSEFAAVPACGEPGPRLTSGQGGGEAGPSVNPWGGGGSRVHCVPACRRAWVPLWAAAHGM